MHDDAGALDVLQKLNPQPGAKMRAFDQARQVGDRKRLVMRPLAHRTTPRLGSSVVKA